MPWIALAMLFGVVVLETAPTLSDPFLVAFLPACLAIMIFGNPRARIPAAVACGYLWALLRAHSALLGDLPQGLDGVRAQVEGQVVGLPARAGQRLRFDLEAQRVVPLGEDAAVPWRGRVRVSWYRGAPAVAPGEHWSLELRLRQRRGLSNPHGFDYEGWLYRQGVQATGAVVARGEHQRQATARGRLLDRLRWRLLSRLEEAVGERPATGILRALVVGERSRISPEQWEVFRTTGTAHLMAISGLHVGLVAAGAFWIGTAVWARAGRAPLRLPAPLAGALAALAAAFGYAALAGFAIPTQRALAMLVVALIAILARRRLAPSRGLALALIAVLVVDPGSAVAPGAWLSFAAVAALLWGLGGGRGPPGGGRLARIGINLLRPQWVVAVGLMPVALVVFGEHPGIGPLANVLAVPWTGALVVPLALAGAAMAFVSPPLGAPILWLAAGAMEGLWPFLAAFSGWPLRLATPAAPAPLAVIAAGVGVAWLLLPRGFPGRWVGVLWILPLLLLPGPRPDPGALHVELLDVGQGLAVVLRTRDHLVLYDAGPRFGAGFDAGRDVVLPHLRGIGAGRIDVLVLSHGDLDHAGGVEAVRARIPIVRAIGNEPPLAPEAEACTSGRAWEADGVLFRILHPGPGDPRTGNDGSCVLRVEATGGTVLLSGDLERRGEERLLRRAASDLRADVLIVPHHGSRSSSTPALVAAVAPTIAMAGVAYGNRFGFPHPEVLDRYHRQGAQWASTDRDGAVTVVLDPRSGPLDPLRERERARRYWHLPRP